MVSEIRVQPARLRAWWDQVLSICATRLYQKSFLMWRHVHVCLPELHNDQRGWHCEFEVLIRNWSCQMDLPQWLTLTKIRAGKTNISSSSLAKNENWYLLTLVAFPLHILLDLLTFSQRDHSMRFRSLQIGSVADGVQFCSCSVYAVKWLIPADFCYLRCGAASHGRWRFCWRDTRTASVAAGFLGTTSDLQLAMTTEK